jgi:hypothetical protein
MRRRRLEVGRTVVIFDADTCIGKPVVAAAAMPFILTLFFGTFGELFR